MQQTVITISGTQACGKKQLAETIAFDLEERGFGRVPIHDEDERELSDARVLIRTVQALDVPPDPEVEAFLDEVRVELTRARGLFPGDRIMTLAFAEEFGEVVKAVLDEPAAAVRKEAVQAATMAGRVTLDGDGSVNEWRAAKGLDPLGRPQRDPHPNLMQYTSRQPAAAENRVDP